MNLRRDGANKLLFSTRCHPVRTEEFEALKAKVSREDRMTLYPSGVKSDEGVPVTISF
jgi:hypothetical protein